jgi:hypothetical protein
MVLSQVSRTTSLAVSYVSLTACIAFLRALELYEGVLFLTTNRVGSFDDAFISRIQVKLQ